MTEKIDEKLKLRFYFVLEVLDVTGFLTRSKKPDTSYKLENFDDQDIEIYNRAKRVSNRIIRDCVDFNYEAGYFLHLFSKVEKETYDALDLLEAVSLYNDVLEKLEIAEKKEEERRESSSKDISKFIDKRIKYKHQNIDNTSGNLNYKTWDSCSTLNYDYTNLD